MNGTNCKFRRLILGMSIEDARSKFDSLESRTFLRLAHERHNQGVLHELQAAQRLRNGMGPEKKCHISRFTKPTVCGFQGYSKRFPDDFVVFELWDDQSTSSSACATDAPSREELKATEKCGTSAEGSGAFATKIFKDGELFITQKELMISTLSAALENIRDNVCDVLTERRQSGVSISGQQGSVVDRLVGEVSGAIDKRCKSLSSSTHLLEPITMSLTLFGAKDLDLLEAFRSNLLCLPAREGNISYSLWVAGGLTADEYLINEFPYYVAKYVVSDEHEGGANQLPRVDVEVYFSSELYQLEKVIGRSGLAALRRFTGKIIMRQHEPTPISLSLLLNTPERERTAYNLCFPNENESIQIPWVHQVKMKVSALTGAIFSAEESEENAQFEKMKEGIFLVWRTWGHLIKDLHVHGDRDFLYVSIDRHKEWRENEEYIKEVKLLEKSRGQKANNPNESAALPVSKAVTSHVMHREHALKGRSYVPLAADFVVVECLLERKGLPHNMVMEDITEALTDMQSQALDMLRLSFLDEVVDHAEASVDIIPVLYAQKVVVSHAGVIENHTHSFQRIRIRGSSLAHVEALQAALYEGDHFTSRALKSTSAAQLSSPASSSSSFSQMPPNLSFTTASAPSLSSSMQPSHLPGRNLAPAGGHSRGGNRFQRHQTLQAYDFMIVSEEESEFWRENYYRLSDIKIVFHDRVDPQDSLMSPIIAFSPRLHEHLKMVCSKLSADDAEPNTGAGEKEGNKISKTTRGGGKTRRKRKLKSIEPTNIAPEKMFEYLCTDMEAEAASYDLRVGDCNAYSYVVHLTSIPLKDVSQVKPAIQSLQNKGFINYFGPTRFASYTKMNMHPGLHLLKGEFRAAAHIIVQQFYLDAAIAAEKRRTGVSFPKAFSMNRYHIPDFAKGSVSKSVGVHGTALQKVLSNALQASQMVLDENGARSIGLRCRGAADRNDNSVGTSAFSFNEDPCAEAFAFVIGPNVCRILINEFLSFVWNDIVNQRLQRYGTFAVLPGDLVRRHPHAPCRSSEYAELMHLSRKDVESGKYSCWDVVLPIPGANVQLPDNHTSDLYVVTLKRFGLVFNPELKQWECFYPLHDIGAAPTSSATNTASSSVGHLFSATTHSPYRMLTSSFALLEEELGTITSFHEPISTLNGLAKAQGLTGNTPLLVRGEHSGRGCGENPPVSGAALARADLQRQQGNPLGLLVEASYRSPLYNVSNTLEWKLIKGNMGDPYQRWGHSMTQTFLPQPTSASQQPHDPAISVANASLKERMRLGSLQDSSVSVPAVEPPSLPQRAAGSYSFHFSPLARRVSQLHRSQSLRQRRRQRELPLPPTSYWLSQHDGDRLELRFTLPAGVYPSMILRELTKLDVNTPDVVDIDRPLVDHRAKSWGDLSEDQQVAYQTLLAKRRQQRFRSERPRALSLALLHQFIFRSGGVRSRLIPTLHSYDSVSK